MKVWRVSHVITLQAVELLLPRIDYAYITDAIVDVEGPTQAASTSQVSRGSLYNWKGEVFASQLVPSVTTLMGPRRRH